MFGLKAQGGKKESVCGLTHHTRRAKYSGIQTAGLGQQHNVLKAQNPIRAHLSKHGTDNQLGLSFFTASPPFSSFLP